MNLFYQWNITGYLGSNNNNYKNTLVAMEHNCFPEWNRLNF